MEVNARELFDLFDFHKDDSYRLEEMDNSSGATDGYTFFYELIAQILDRVNKKNESRVRHDM